MVKMSLKFLVILMSKSGFTLSPDYFEFMRNGYIG